MLVILGLLTGGILAGQNLIRAAEMRSVSTQYGQYVTAIATFRDKYFALPGDMRNAVDFWGIAAGSTGNDTTCRAAPTTDGTTCNGNGDGIINNVTSSYEPLRSWQHLANAGLIEGNYQGYGTTTYGLEAIRNVTTPAGKVGSTTTWNFVRVENSTGVFSSAFFHRDFGDALIFGGTVPSSWNYTNVLSPEEAWNIDTKMDDGLPAQGKVASRQNTCTDATGPTQLTANYNLTNSASSCIMLFMTDF